MAPPTRATRTDLRYHPEHDWVRDDGDERSSFGITWYAQDALGEVVFFDPPAGGRHVTQDESYAEVESVKAVSATSSRRSRGEVIEVNEALGDEPEAINEDPYGDGWMVRVRLSDVSEKDDLLDAAAYRALTSAEGPCEPLHRRSPTPTCEQMLAAIGASSIEELFDEIPEGVRLRRAARPAGGDDRAGRLRAPARPRARATPRAEDEITFLGAGMYDHYVPALIDSCCSALGVPHAVHALPAGDQPGRPAGDVRVPDGDQRADRPAGLQRVGLRGPARRRRGRVPREARQRRAATSSSRAACTRTAARRCARSRTATAWRSSRSRCAAGVTDPAGLGARDRRRHLGRDLPAAELPRRGRGLAPRSRAAAKAVGAWSSAPTTRSRSAILAAPGELRRRRRGRRGPDARQPPGLRRPVVRLLRRDRGVPAPHARPDRRRDDATSTAAAGSC